MIAADPELDDTTAGWETTYEISWSGMVEQEEVGKMEVSSDITYVDNGSGGTVAFTQ